MINQYSISNLVDLDTPALVVYPDLVKANIQLAVDMVGDVNRLRPHIKTHKTAEVIFMCQSIDIHKYKCATIAEAELLGLCEAKDVLLSYQPIGKKAERFMNLIKAYPSTRYSCIIDNVDVAHNLNDLAYENELKLDIFLDINLGMNRTGIKPENALKLAESILHLKNINLLGLHAYDGNIRDSDFAARKINCDAGFDLLLQLEIQIKKLGYTNLSLVVGGSPTFPIHCKRKHVECSPGTFVFWDKGYQDLCPEQEFIPSVLAITRIISLPDENTICTDLGHKSIAPENELIRRVFFINAPELAFVGQSEEHLVLKAQSGHKYKIGDVLYGIPIHICPTIALHDQLFKVEKKMVTGVTWKVVARDRIINY